MKFIKDYLLKHRARSREHFFELLQGNGFLINYDNRINPIGIIDTRGKKYSWAKLGITPEDLYHLDHKKKLHQTQEQLNRLEELVRIRQVKDQNQEREL